MKSCWSNVASPGTNARRPLRSPEPHPPREVPREEDLSLHPSRPPGMILWQKVRCSFSLSLIIFTEKIIHPNRGIARVLGTSWDDSDSSASYTCPMDSVGSAGSGGRPVLDNIAELRESAEQLLDCSPPRTPPRSPAPRRLVKPPVNSHLHRSASIAPGMKAKKYDFVILIQLFFLPM